MMERTVQRVAAESLIISKDSIKTQLPTKTHNSETLVRYFWVGPVRW